MFFTSFTKRRFTLKIQFSKDLIVSNSWKINLNLPHKSDLFYQFFLLLLWIHPFFLISLSSNSFGNNCMLLSCHVRDLERIHALYTLYVKELLARSRRKTWRLRDCNWTRTHNHSVRKRALNHLANLAKFYELIRLWTKWLWVRVQLQSLLETCLQYFFSRFTNL